MVDLNGKLKLHPDFRHETLRVGNEQAPVLVIDDYLSDPGIVIDHVAAQAVFMPGTASYPGVRAVVPPVYVHGQRLFLSAIIREAFGIESDRLEKAFCGFSLVTTPPEKLDLVQRLPHFDSTNTNQIALLHYLCPPGKGGTAFYRHRRTGFERIDEGRVETYTRSVNAEIGELGPPPARYVNGSNAQFERIAVFEPVFNRVLAYRSTNLHSADIAPDFDFDPHPRSGRLTVNALFTFA